MNSFPRFNIKEQLKLAAVLLIVWRAPSMFGQEAEQTFLTAGSYSATTGGSISGSATIAGDTAPSCNSGGFDYTWTDYLAGDGEDQWAISLVGTG
ncbi:MAG: hypothetical protein ACRED1_15450, partial [Limisphaerales bacterium]